MVTKYQKRKNKTWEWKLHLLCSSLCFRLSPSPPSPLISAAGENNAVFLILWASVVHKHTIEAIFSRQGIDELYILRTPLPNVLKVWPRVLLSLFYLNKCVCANTARLKRFHGLFIFFNRNNYLNFWWLVEYFLAISVCGAMAVYNNRKWVTPTFTIQPVSFWEIWLVNDLRWYCIIVSTSVRNNSYLNVLHHYTPSSHFSLHILNFF